MYIHMYVYNTAKYFEKFPDEMLSIKIDFIISKANNNRDFLLYFNFLSCVFQTLQPKIWQI